MKKSLKSLVKRLFSDKLFGDVGLNNAPNRDIWVQQQLEALPAGSKLLDAGAGECHYKPYCSHLDYTSQDFCEYNGVGDGKANQPGKWDVSKIDIVSDIIDIPVKDSSFDVILCTEVFEHIFSPEAAVREFSRILKSGGRLILTAPFCSRTHFSPYHFSTGFNRYWYERVLQDNGFKILSITPNGNYFGYIAQEMYNLRSVGKRYSGLSRGLLGFIAQAIMLRKLNVMSRHDKGSSELLCFGYHVLAQKL